ncbi:glycosyltransferase family 4 protein [Clostridium beijerinckii]|uniref:glycosyltransferase family 4 protein n=1 Tax=Clostridium beijerinckii TaxID=1520 RepID=UPI0023313C5D|nr:glycosyltransferase family 1 protein [Clostridium beijerinckii]
MIVFNALQTSLNAGIGRYSYELAKELYMKNPKKLKIVIRKEDQELFSFARSEDLIIAANIKNSKIRNIYEQLKLPWIIHKKFPDAIIHYPDTMAPLFSKNKVVITIHDLAFKSLKGVFTWKTVWWKNFITNLSIGKADKIIAITKFTKDEILKHYPKISEEKIVVIYNGFNDFSKESIREKNVGDKIKNINKPYILTVSTISPRKNIDGLIKAFNRIKGEVNENLIIVGSNGWMYNEVYKLAEQLELNDRVIFMGKVNDDELKYLYRNAKIFAYLSFYEGFGLPPLEAMSYEIPCLVSDIGSISEVVEDKAIKVTPYSIEEISKYLLEMTRNSHILDRKGMSKHIKKFSWRICAKETFDAVSSINIYL